MKNTGLMIVGTLGAIFIGFFAPLIAYLLKDNLNENERGIIATMLNFELSLLIVCVILSFIPILGHIACALLWVGNLIYAIMAFVAAKDNTQLKPIALCQFVK